MTTPHHYDLVVVLVASWLAIESASYLDPQGRPVPAWRHEASRELVKDLRRLAISFPQRRLKVRLFSIPALIDFRSKFGTGEFRVVRPPSPTARQRRRDRREIACRATP